MGFKPDFNQFLKVLQCEEPDYVPLYEHYADRAVMESILNRKHPSAKNKKEFMKFYVDFYQKLEFDVLPCEFGLNLFKLGGYSASGRMWANHHVATISSMEEFDEYPWPDVEDAIDYGLLEAVSELLPNGMKIACGVAGGVQEHVIGLVGLKHLSIAIRRKSKFMDKLFQKIGDLIREVDKIIAEKDYVCALRMGDDMGFKEGLLLNPKIVRKHVLPRHKEIVEVAHKKGKPFILHSCGNLAEIREELIEEVKVDAFHSFEENILPITDAKKQFGNRVALLGGVDIDKLCRLTAKELENYCKNIIETCKIDGGFAFGTGNSVASYIPIEKYKLMLSFRDKYGRN